jgi:hypothetical protein
MAGDEFFFRAAAHGHGRLCCKSKSLQSQRQAEAIRQPPEANKKSSKKSL